MDETRSDFPLSSGEHVPSNSPLDALLDQALAGYAAAAEPSPDLAAQLLDAMPPAGIPARPAPPAATLRRPLTWLLAGSGWMAAAVALLLWLEGRPFQIVLKAPAVLEQHEPAPAAAAPMASIAIAPLPASHASAVHARSPHPAAVLDPIVLEPIRFAPIANGQERP